MYRVEQLNAETWAILDARDVRVFQGTLRQCEDWLDAAENRDRAARPSTSWSMELKQWVGRIFSSKTSTPPSADDDERQSGEQTSPRNRVDVSAGE